MDENRRTKTGWTKTSWTKTSWAKMNWTKSRSTTRNTSYFLPCFNAQTLHKLTTFSFLLSCKFIQQYYLYHSPQYSNLNNSLKLSFLHVWKTIVAESDHNSSAECTQILAPGSVGLPQTGKTTTITRTAVREAYVSRQSRVPN